MRISTVREFRDKATMLLKSKDPVLVTRRGRLAGVFVPSPDGSLPAEFKRELFEVLSSQIRRDLEAQGTREADVLKDFADFRKQRGETRRRR